MIEGHSLRHLTAALCPLALFVALGVRKVTGTLSRASAALASILVANYFSMSPTDHAQAGSPRLFASRDRSQALTDQMLRGGRELAAVHAERKLLVGGPGIPYCEYVMLEQAVHFVRRVLIPGVAWELDLSERGRAPTTTVSVESGLELPATTPAGTLVVWHAEHGRLPSSSTAFADFPEPWRDTDPTRPLGRLSSARD